MDPRTRDWAIVIGEAVLFGMVLLVLWLDEFVDLPHALLGAPRTPYRIEEYLFETVSILVVAAFVITATIIIQYRARKVERFLRVCAWCRKVWVDERWVRFEEYIQKSQSLRSSHGICDECVKKFKATGPKKSDTEDTP
ncbi:MAG TPA: hypothetical protein PLT09_07090 [Deltaproteobacteria bacterium]|nr:hypothetical protein [Deltaproteobacteria bacterium]HPR53673.1 hypothetical protein [Deltaproteobacteria bacterium]HXK47189.1 hypothetical protein [Deltaproteobacteria bacterium]